MPRYKADTPTMFIDNSRYRGDDRRMSKRVKALIPATLHAAGAEEIVKIVDISEGGCAWVGHLLVNVQATVSLQFYNQTEEGYVSCQPIHGRVVHVHKKENKNSYLINCDFKGILFEEHGVRQLIEANTKRK